MSSSPPVPSSPTPAVVDVKNVPWKNYLYLFLLALGSRLFLLWALPREDRIIGSYDAIAINLIEGRGFSYNGADPTVCRAPGYPVYLAAIFSIFGHSPVPFHILRLCDSVLDSLTTLLIVGLSCLWFPNLSRGFKLAAGYAYALNPFGIYYLLKLGSETLSIFLFSANFFMLHKAFINPKHGLRNVLLFGVLSGMLVLN